MLNISNQYIGLSAGVTNQNWIFAPARHLFPPLIFRMARFYAMLYSFWTLWKQALLVIFSISYDNQWKFQKYISTFHVRYYISSGLNKWRYVILYIYQVHSCFFSARFNLLFLCIDGVQLLKDLLFCISLYPNCWNGHYL